MTPPSSDISEEILVISYERKECDVASTLDGGAQATLLAFGKTGLLASFDLAVNIYVALQGLEVLVVKVSDVCLVLKNFSHAVYSLLID
jgi:hypothetical protein